MTAETFRFNVGNFACIAILDGTAKYAAPSYFANAPAELLKDALQDYHLRADDIPSPYSGLLISTERQRVLVDTGAGSLSPTVGRLQQNLRSAGIVPAEIDLVILTHGHPDHIGGNTDDDGNLAFPNARFAMCQVEWEYWTAEATLATVPPLFAECARKNLAPLRGRIDLIDRDTEIVPGIQTIAAPGHTVGHMALAVASGDDQLLYISDAALHPIHLEHPDWYTVWDINPGQAVNSRRRLFDRAAATNALVSAFHFDPFPSLGRVTSSGSGWQWESFWTERS
jgi:glyoxylase-like metal-dependent hydrolase (beta-lactamase superfamily II)